MVLAEQSFAVRNPATGREIDHVPDLGIDGVARAVEAAYAARRDWAARPVDERADLLQAAAARLRGQVQELARIITAENGKPLAESEREALTCARHLQWFGEEARRVYGRIVSPSLPDRRYLVLKQPVGVVAALTPWNFPASMATRKVAPALAAGCPVVLRPASATPLSALYLRDLLHAAGVPPDVFAVVTTRQSAAVGELLATHPHVRKLTFTGSTEVGKTLMRLAAGTVKRVSMELGGHGPAIVFADADQSRAAAAVIVSRFHNAGQTCIGTNRLYVERPVLESFAAEVSDRARALSVGDGALPGTEVGPLIDQAALDRMEEHVRDAVARGARVTAGGRQLHLDGLGGIFFEPTVLANVAPESRVLHEETFGPVLPIVPFTNEEEAVRMANDTTYGLASYLYTRDVGRVFRIAETLEFGLVGVNDPIPTVAQIPFGGMKESGVGRELGAEGIEEFLEVKTISIGL